MGQWDAAARHYALAFRASVLGHDLAAAVDALRGQARVRNHQRRFDEAEELAGLSLEIAERHGLRQCAARALNVLGIILLARGEWEEARTLFPRALEMALDLGDDDLAGLACQNAGVIANALGEFREARTLFLECIGSFVRSGNSVHAMLAYNNLGLASAELREWMDAEVYFSRGIEIGERLSHSPMLAKLYCNRAEPLIQVGELARARATLDRAEQAAEAVGDRATLAETWRYRAMIASMEGSATRRRATCGGAMSIADDVSLTLERARAVRQLGILRAEQGQHGGGPHLFGPARDLFRLAGRRRARSRGHRARRAAGLSMRRHGGDQIQDAGAFVEGGRVTFPPVCKRGARVFPTARPLPDTAKNHVIARRPHEPDVASHSRAGCRRLHGRVQRFGKLAGRTGWSELRRRSRVGRRELQSTPRPPRPRKATPRCRLEVWGRRAATDESDRA